MSRADCLTRAAAIAVALLVSAPQSFAAPSGDRMPSAQTAVVRGTDKAVHDYSLAVQRRMQSTSVAELERFGLAASREPTRENLGRLQHVIAVTLGQREVEHAVIWNARLKDLATRAGDADYLAAIEINDYAIRLIRDRDVSLEQLDALVARQKSWLPRALAKGLKTHAMIDEGQAAAAIVYLHEALREVPTAKAGEAGIAAMLWRQAALAHSQLDDVAGFLKTIQTSERLMADTGYPWPDYEPMFNLSMALGYVGRHDAALQVYGVYDELARKDGSLMPQSMSGLLCSYIASARDDWAGVLKCYEPFGPDLAVPRQLQNLMRVRRVIAYSRTGQVALARRDINALRAGLDTGQVKMSPIIQRAEAEYMIASGDYARGVPALRDYHVSEFRRAAQASSEVMSSIVGDLSTQLEHERSQSIVLEETISRLIWMFAAVAVLGVGLLVLLFRQRRLSRELKLANDREKELHARRTQFFADVSHEIRTPLNGVVAMADALRKEQLPPDVAEKVRLIATSSETLNRLLSDVLDNAKMDAGQLTIETEVFDLVRVVKDVEALWRSKAEAKGLKLALQMDAGDSYWVRGDSVRVSEVLNNLISNALKFTPQGRILVSTVRLPHERCLFVVTDTGIGFEGASDGRVFQPYRQADTSISRKFGGTGLGLSISSKLVEMMGGRLNASSKPGAGSQFWFELPLPEAERPSVEDVALQPVTKPDVLRVLITDDNPTNRTILGMLLGGDDYVLHYAVNGQEAVDLAAAVDFDVILMDVQMPVMDGLEAIRRIRAGDRSSGQRQAAIVIFSASDSAEDLKSGMEAGADCHVSKPIVLDRLLEAMQAAIQLRARHNAANQADIMTAVIDN
ncbi:ATP-binding protein [Brevundimonas sp. GN22]